MAQKVNAITNGYMILRLLAAQDQAQGVTEIAKSTGISPSSCFNILRTLTDLELAAFDTKTKAYSLGLSVFELARNGLLQNPMLAAAQPFLITLAQRYSATLGLWDISNNIDPVLMSMGQSSSRVTLLLKIGSHQPFGAGSVGRAVLAMSQNDIPRFKMVFSGLTWEGSITFDEYLDDINKARQQGFAVDRDKYFLGITTVSTAFLDRKTGRAYCLTAVLLSGAHDESSINAVGSDLKSAAQSIVDIS